ncbi:PKD domain-containing protein [Shewanella sp. GXUN23E]|uniref:PKD domain-containing protein n=1 Tax=Shewanella sp. GXUN23E TaxID=3422498 RepID=UPI003D7DEAE4
MKYLSSGMLALMMMYSGSSLVQATEDSDNTIKVRFLVAAEEKDGTGAQATEEMLAQGIEQLNLGYQEMGLQFSLGDTLYITNEEVPGFHNPDDGWDTDEEELLRPFFALDSYNIIVTELSGKNGHAWWPYEATDAVEVDPVDLVRTTPVHEIGHNLSLLHTYQGKNDGPISLLEGLEGWKYGDKVIDTPADPDRDDLIENCVYSGDVLDEEGVPYAPDAANFMSGGSNKCRTHFSPQQQARMQRILSTDKYHLLNTYGMDRALPTCSNTSSVTAYPHHEGFNINEAVAPFPWVQDVKNNRFNWRFDSDTSSSRTGADEPVDGHSFIHVDTSNMEPFITAGDHVAMLSPCYDFTRVVAPSMSFYFNMYGAHMGNLAMQASIDDGQSWQPIWQMDGPQHTDGDWELAQVDLSGYTGKKVQFRLDYQVDGEKGDASVDAITLDANYPPVADFTVETQGLRASFQSTSSDEDGELLSYLWDFGDGSSADSEQANHKFHRAGDYQVSLTVTDEDGLSDTRVQTVSVPNHGNKQKPVAVIRHIDMRFIQLFISQSYDPDGYIKSHKWKFNNGSRINGPVAVIFGHRASKVKLEVTDNDNLKGKAKLRF